MSARRGFTLLEVLVASALAAVVMAGLWYAYRDYGRLFDKGQAKVERAQLARALLDQLADDLRSAIPDAGAEAAGEGGVRRFALFGSPQSLQIDVLQLTPASALLAHRDESREAERSTTEAPAAPQVPELHSVRYSFRSPRTNQGTLAAEEQDQRSEPEIENLVGLVRQESDWETPTERSEIPGRPRTGRPRPGAADDAPGAARRRIGATAVSSEELQGGTLTVVPEVAGIEFRYYDGKGWADQWNSLTRKSLPVAVEIVLRLKDDNESEPSSGEENSAAEEASAEPTWEEIAEFLGETKVESGQVERMLVHLPTAALPYGARRERPGAAPIEADLPAQRTTPSPPLAPLAVPLLPSPPLRSSEPSAPTQGDRWMRSGS